MKKFFIFLLIASFLVTAMLPAPAAAVQFPDIKGHWAETYINSLAGAGYIKGYPEGTFKPDNTMTRAEFTTLLISSMGISPQASSANGFSDISNHWGKNFINEAVRRGILISSEYPTGLVPDGNIKRSEAAAMLIRALGESPDTGSLPPFSDLADVERSMYKAHIKRAFDLKLLSGFPGGEFQPFADMTRAQVAKVLTDFLTLYDGTSPIASNPTVIGNISSIAVGDEKFSLNQNPVIFRFAYTSVPLNSIAVTGNQVTINNTYNFFLNSALGNPDLIINNNSYAINKYTVSGDILVAFPQARTIDSLEVSGYRYNTDFVQLFVNSAYGDYYLSDLEIVDQYNVKVAGKNFNLINDRLTITLGSKFYDITRINLSSPANPLVLSETDRVIADGMRMSDISAIFVDDGTLNLDDINKIEFMIDNEMYGLRDIVIDASGQFTANRKTYDFDDVYMYIDGWLYIIEDISLYREKFIFYCEESSTGDLVLVNDKYRDIEDVEIIKGTSAYALDDILVISRNLIRIGSKQYTVDSTFKVRMDGKIYDIDRLDYDLRLDIIKLKLTESDDDYDLSDQPDRYIFYVDGVKYQDGVRSNTSIYVNRQWIAFDRIALLSPASFSYNGRAYDMIGSEIKLSGEEFTVIDTSWTGLRKIFSLYLE